MKKWFALPLFFLLHCLAAQAQIYDVPCPNGTNVWSQVVNGANGHYKA